MRRYRLLMSVGPTECPPYVLKEMSRPIYDLRDRDLIEIHLENLELLRRIFHSSGKIMVFASSSFSAMEAAIANLVEPGDPVLVINSGFFSGFMAEMAQIHGGRVFLTPSFEEQPITLDAFENALSECDAKVVCMVHNETGTGLRTPIERLCLLAHSYDALTVVDVVSTLGGMRVDVDGWRIDVAFAGCQKCLNVPPTLSVASISERAWQSFENRKNPVKLWYLNFKTLKMAIGEKPIFPYTFPIHSILALNASLKHLLAEGLENVYERHKRESTVAKRFVRELGLSMHNRCEACPGCENEEAYCALTVTAFKTPIQAMKVVEKMEHDHGVRISAGLREHQEDVLRIGHMGWQAQPPFTKATLTSLASTLKNLGLKLNYEEALAGLL
ncbi:MAG: alanine--glyoxylate aminotransferase family protein [Candidatus Jordarchaeales archaeon]|nr:alanine--glyoxylate aminotransferase family protein [Candidatus Jordarchaeia archaeon]